MRAVQHLDEACALLNSPDSAIGTSTECIAHAPSTPLELADVKGQLAAKRALEIAAAGAHHLLLIGPPGTGKTMLAERLTSLLPPLDERDALEVVRIHSARGSFDPQFLHGARPLRAPHHTASAAAMVGGGARIPQTRARSRSRTAACCSSMSCRSSTAACSNRCGSRWNPARSSCRARRCSVCYPARFQLVAAMNPCPAGRACTTADCICTPDQQNRYRSRVSGPVLDRIDLRVSVPAVSSEVLFAAPSKSTDTNDIRARIEAARRTQLARAGKLNSALTAPEVDAYCELDIASRRLIERAMERLGLSARGVHRVLKVGRTLADLVWRASHRADPCHRSIGVSGDVARRLLSYFDMKVIAPFNSSSLQFMQVPFGGIAFKPLMTLFQIASLPFARRGAQSAALPFFGAPPTPAA